MATRRKKKPARPSKIEKRPKKPLVVTKVRRDKLGRFKAKPKPKAKAKPKAVVRPKPRVKAKVKAKAKPKVRTRPETPGARRRRLAKEIAAISETFVYGAELQFLHRNGTLALYPSLLRHLRARDYWPLYRFVKRAVDRDDEIGLMRLTELAEKMQVSLRELYTLVMSP